MNRPGRGASRHLLRCGGSLALLLLLGVAPAAARPAPVVSLDTASITDPDVATALQEGLNLPWLLAADEASGLPPPRLLQDQIDRECRRLTSLVRSYGYLEAEVACTPEMSGEANGLPRAIHISPRLGPLYRLGIIEIIGVAGRISDAEVEKAVGGNMTRYIGQPARADRLAELESRALRLIRAGNHPLATISRREIVRQADQRLAEAKLEIDVGSVARFGAITYRGFIEVSAKSIGVMIPFRTGDDYDVELLAELRRRLIGTGWFQSVRVDAGSELDGQGRLPVNIIVKEQPPDARKLFSSGEIFATAQFAALAGIAFRLLAKAAKAPRGFLWANDAAILLLLGVAATTAVLRVLSLI